MTIEKLKSIIQRYEDKITQTVIIDRGINWFLKWRSAQAERLNLPSSPQVYSPVEWEKKAYTLLANGMLPFVAANEPDVVAVIDLVGRHGIKIKKEWGDAEYKEAVNTLYPQSLLKTIGEE